MGPVFSTTCRRPGADKTGQQGARVRVASEPPTERTGLFRGCALSWSACPPTRYTASGAVRASTAVQQCFPPLWSGGAPGAVGEWGPPAVFARFGQYGAFRTFLLRGLVISGRAARGQREHGCPGDAAVSHDGDASRLGVSRGSGVGRGGRRRHLPAAATQGSVVSRTWRRVRARRECVAGAQATRPTVLVEPDSPARGAAARASLSKMESETGAEQDPSVAALLSRALPLMGHRNVPRAGLRPASWNRWRGDATVLGAVPEWVLADHGRPARARQTTRVVSVSSPQPTGPSHVPARSTTMPHSAKLPNRLVGILHGCLKIGMPYDETTAWRQQRQHAT